MKTRLALGAPGALLALYGIFRILTDVNTEQLIRIGCWLVGALVVHDGFIAPITGTLGLAVRRIPARARAFVQGGLLAGALVSAVAVVFIRASRVRQPPAKALLRQDYVANLAILLGIVAGLTTALYLGRLIRDHRRSATK